MEIDPARDEGPAAIELASDRPLALPDDALGVTWRVLTRRPGGSAMAESRIPPD